MITLKMMGGLGNQMFIYAFGKKLASLGYEVQFDASGYSYTNKVIRGGGQSISSNPHSQTIRNLEILNFPISLPITNIPNNSILLNTFQKIYHKLSPKQTILLEKDIADLSKIPKNIYIQGHFVKLSFFQDIQDNLIQEFSSPTLSPHNQQWKEKILNTPNSAFIHIRRGDYLWDIHWEHTKLGKTYYDKAIQYIQSKTPTTHFFIFSNDISWCKKNIKLFNNLNDANTTFVEGNHEGMAIEEMELMKACQHSIMANSTFSWWAGFLNSNPSKTCIFPSQTTYNPQTNWIKNLIVPDWIIIDHLWGEVLSVDDLSDFKFKN